MTEEMAGATARVVPSERFSAWKSRNFRLYIYGQMVSFSGTRMQTVALGYLISQMTHSGAWLGLIAGVATFPGAIFTPIGGVLMDRFDTRKVLYLTQVAGIIQALTLGALALLHLLNRWEMLVLAFISGIVTVVDAPARRTFIMEIVEKRDLYSANTVNTAIVHLSQLIGPTVGGILIVLMDPGWTFIVNAATFVPVIGILFVMQLKRQAKVQVGIWETLREGIAYVYSRKQIRYLIILYGAATGLGYSVVSILPGVADTVFHSPRKALACLIASVAVGAVTGALLVMVVHEFSPRKFVIAGFLSMSVALSTFSLGLGLPASMVSLFFGGLGFTLVGAVLQTTIQHLVGDLMRGRVTGLITAALFSGISFGSIVLGKSVDWFGVSHALMLNGAALFLVASFAVWFRRDIPSQRV